MKLKTLVPWKESYDQPRQHIKKQRYYFANKGPSSQGYGSSSSHGWMWELDYKENWVLKNWSIWTVVLGKTLESPLDSKEIQPVHPEGNQPWIFTGRTNAEAETPILWPPDVKNWLIGKDPDAGKDWRWEKGITENQMVGWHHWPNGHEFEYALGVGDGQGGLACCSPWGCKEFDTTDQLNNNNSPKLARRRGKKWKWSWEGKRANKRWCIMGLTKATQQNTTHSHRMDTERLQVLKQSIRGKRKNNNFFPSPVSYWSTRH